MAKDVITRFRLETTQFDSKIKSAAKELSEYTKAASNAGKEFQKFTKDNVAAAQALGKMATSSQDAKGKVKELVGAFNEAAKAYNALTKEQQQSDFGKAMAASLTQLQQRIRETKAEMQSMGNVSKNMGGGFSGVMGNMSKVLGVSPAMLTGIGAAAAAFAGLKEVIGGNISTAMGFEKSMSQLSSLTGMTGKDLDKLKEYAIDLGSTSTLTASQVADAFRLIGSQQPQLLSSGEALKEVTKYAITLSEAAGIDLQTAAQTLSTSINQMGGDSNNAARYVNVLAAASQKGAGDIAWLGEAITKSATAAKAVGTDYEELVANLEQLAKAGFDASTAGTALRSIIMNLEKQANQDFKPSIVGLTQAFENLGKANLDIVGYQQIAGKMFASQAMALANAAEEAKNMTVAITGTSTATEQAATNTANLDGSLKALASAWEGLNLHINSSNGLLKDSVDWLKDVVTWVDKAISGMDKYAKRKAEMNNESAGGGNTKIDRMITNLSGTSDSLKSSVYNQQLEQFNRYINKKEAELNKTRNTKDVWAWETLEKNSKIGQLTQDIGAAKQMLDEYKQRAKSVMQSVSKSTQTNGTGNPTITIDVDVDSEEAAKSIKDLQEEIKKLKKLRDDAANDGNTKLRDQYNTQIKSVQAQIKSMRGTGSTSTNHKTTPEYIPLEGSIDAQTKKVQDLQKAWRAAADDKSREDIKKQIEQAQLVLDAMNGKTKTSKITITADTKEALEAVKKIDGVKIEPKSFTVTAEDDKAADELRKMGAVQIADKTFSVISDIGDTLEKVKAIDGVKIDPKSFTVTAEDDKAADELRKMGAVQIDDKTFSVISDIGDTLEKVKAIDGVKIDPKTFVITAETTEALAKIQEINGIKIQPKKLEVQVPKMSDIAPNGLTGKARTPEDLQQGAVKIKQAVQLEIDQEASKVDETTLHTLIKDAIQNGINGMDLQFGTFGEQIGKGIDIPDDSWQGILDQYNALREQIGLEPIVIDFETGKIDKVVREVDKLKKTINTTANVVGTIGQAFNAIEDPAAKVAGTVAQAIANIAMAYSDALAKDQTSKFNIWGFIAASAASMVSMATTIAQIHSQTGYAEGGVVKGNHYSGDMLDGGSFGINAGELVLNRAQQGSLASQLEGGGLRNLRLSAEVQGEKIVLVANRYFRRTGQGEIVTWK